MNTFNKYWSAAYASNKMPGIFDAAMRELASKAWNAALVSAANIANTNTDQNAITSKIEDLTVTGE